AEMADFVVVMYAGRIVEKGTALEGFTDPLHPYTVGLMASKPVVNRSVERLYSIPGNVPNPINMPNYCYFKDRCERRMPVCDGAYPEEVYLTETHMVTCYHYINTPAEV
ncbi:MAG TPA: methionine ABC transporter ATP-binding protein, partial [Bellilinea sp.]|nr:methionine ABC transporter ATP-binding protein [Bellilinea sp.]